MTGAPTIKEPKPVCCLTPITYSLAPHCGNHKIRSVASPSAKPYDYKNKGEGNMELLNSPFELISDWTDSPI